MERSGLALLGPPNYNDSETGESPSAPVLEIPQLLPVPGYWPSLAQANPNDPIDTEPSLDITTVPLVCPYCRLHVQTRVLHKPGKKAHLVALCLCFFGLFCLALIPYTCRNLLTAEHYCGSCGGYVGIYND